MEASRDIRPEQTDAPVVTDPPEYAAGKPAVVEVLRQIVCQAGSRARGDESLLKMNQAKGFDCPGCAWPEDIEHRKQAEFCENGAKAFADEATRQTVDAEFFARHSVAELLAQSDQWLNEQGRLAQPMVLQARARRITTPITWFSAFELIAEQLKELDSPDQAAFYTSGRTSNEAAFLWQLFARCFGTNNLPDCSNMCHESSGTALTEVIGSGKGTVRLSDFDQADAIFVLGQNPGSNHPRMLATLERAKQQGAVIVAVNPLDEVGIRNFRNPQSLRGLFGKGSELVDLHVPVRINGDVAFLKGLCKAMLEAEAAAARYGAGSGVHPEAHQWFWCVRDGHPEDARGLTSKAAVALVRRMFAQAAAIAINGKEHDLLLGNGDDPAQECGGQYSGDRQLPDVAREPRAARCGCLSCARA